MKAKYILYVLACACVLGACNRDEESLFDKSAAERAQEALQNANKVLTGAENGWEMLYFANLDSRGYNMILRFNADGQVIATAKNATTTGNKLQTDSVSTWEVKNDYGPILTFDTYNEVFHAWADPGYDGDGLLGDYEFLILHADSSYVKLKGKKHGGYSYLYPLASGTTAETYFAEVEQMSTKLFANNNLLTWQCGDESYLLHNGNSGIFSLTKPGEPVVEEVADIYPFVENREGIQLTVGILNDKETFYRFETDRLIGGKATIGPSATNTYVLDYLNLASGTWVMNLKNLCDPLQTLRDAADEAMRTAYSNPKKAGITAMDFTIHSNQLVMALSYIGKGSKANTYYYLYDITKSNDKLVLHYNAPQDENAKKVLDAFPSVDSLLQHISGEFALSTVTAYNPTYGIHMIENSNAALWIDLTGKAE